MNCKKTYIFLKINFKANSWFYLCLINNGKLHLKRWTFKRKYLSNRMDSIAKNINGKPVDIKVEDMWFGPRDF